MRCEHIVSNFVISLVASGLAGILVGLIFERRAGRTINRAMTMLKDTLVTDFSKIISNEITNLSTKISDRITDLSDRIRQQLGPIANAVNKISDGIDELIEYLKKRQ